jgi:hypothetical protein
MNDTSLFPEEEDESFWADLKKDATTGLLMEGASVGPIMVGWAFDRVRADLAKRGKPANLTELNARWCAVAIGLALELYAATGGTVLAPKITLPPKLQLIKGGDDDDPPAA